MVNRHRSYEPMRLITCRWVAPAGNVTINTIPPIQIVYYLLYYVDRVILRVLIFDDVMSFLNAARGRRVEQYCLEARTRITCNGDDDAY